MKRGPVLATVEIDQPKIVAYLLNASHPKGGPKARFFLACGFSREDPEQLANALFAHLSAATTSVIGRKHPGGFGLTQIARGPMAMPNGTSRDVCSIWLTRLDGETISFVTAYPD